MSARQQVSGPADMLLDAHDPEPAQGTITPKAIEAPRGRVVHAIAEPPVVTEPEPAVVESIESEPATVEVAATSEAPAADPAPRRPARSQARHVAGTRRGG
ncbi:hypothetical protein [Nannocystis pusilla]|uniref:hypothetical protein n=1 Tax=Nannocystis pusilla TaxID=889268 RepID=UPI003B821D3F